MTATPQEGTAPPAGGERARSRLLRLLGSATALVALGFVVFTLQTNLAALPPLSVSPTLLVCLVAGVAANVAVVLISAQAWRVLLRGAGHVLPLRQAFVLCGTAQIGKYLPGNVFHLVGRATLAYQRASISFDVSAASLALETALVLLAGTLVGAPFILTRSAAVLSLLGVSSLWLWAVVVIVAGMSGAFVFVLARPRVAALLQRLRQMTTWRTVLQVLCWDIVTFVVLGTALYLTAAVAWPDAFELSWMETTLAFTVAWVLGFVTPGAPGGIGVREAVFLLVLGGNSQSIAVGASLSVASRLLSVCGDVVTFGLARLLDDGRKAEASKGDASTTEGIGDQGLVANNK